MPAPSDPDADLADLLPSGSGGSGGGDAEKIPLNRSLDALAGAKGGGYYRGSGRGGGGICALISAHLSYLCWEYPACCGCISCIMMLFCVSALVSEVVNPTQNFGVVKHDWTTVSSIYELDAGKIDHWCLGGGNEGCRCEDPLVPTSRAELRSWTEAYKDNKRMIDKYMDDPLIMAELDVAIVGESAVEEMDGRWLGKFRNDELKNIGRIFRNHFHKDKGAKVEGVALGIAGDSAGNVLWRLIHGEMPEGFNPKIWWISLGMNDLTRQQCSEEVVVMGVLRVVEEILKRRPRARVVVNSLLPMADLRGGTVVTEKDYRDAFSTYRGKRTRTATTHYVRKQVDGKETFERVPGPPARKKPSSSESNDNKGGRRRQRQRRTKSRRLLEAALDAYNARENDNSDEIERLQRKLNEEILSMAKVESSKEVSTNRNDDNNKNAMMQRKLEEEGIPKVAKKDKYNPVIDREKLKQKKYNFFRKRRMPLWTSIYAINKQLFKFCEKHDQVDFFDATNIFAERRGDVDQKYFTLLSDNISARGHPTQIGFLKWEDEMVKKVQQVLKEMKSESPDQFLWEPEGPGLGGGLDSAETVERMDKKPFVDDKRGEDMEAEESNDGEKENQQDEDQVEKDEDEGQEGGEAEPQNEVEAEEGEEGGEGEGGEDGGDEVMQQPPQTQTQQYQNSVTMQRQPESGMQQNSMMMQQQQQQQPGMQQNAMMQPGMHQSGSMDQQPPGMQQLQQQPGMQPNGMMMQQQQPGIQPNGMMQQQQQQPSQQQQGMQQNGMMMGQQQPGMQQRQPEMMQQQGMQQKSVMQQQPVMQQYQNGVSMQQQPGMQQNSMMMQQQPGMQPNAMMQPGMHQSGSMDQQPPGMQQQQLQQPPQQFVQQQGGQAGMQEGYQSGGTQMQGMQQGGGLESQQQYQAPQTQGMGQEGLSGGGGGFGGNAEGEDTEDAGEEGFSGNIDGGTIADVDRAEGLADVGEEGGQFADAGETDGEEPADGQLDGVGFQMGTGAVSELAGGEEVSIAAEGGTEEGVRGEEEDTVTEGGDEAAGADSDDDQE